ncbi:hypothetical protein AKJ40_04905, partial [candidate division MSBL1 archaeon SCGC-AAA259M10]
MFEKSERIKVRGWLKAAVAILIISFATIFLISAFGLIGNWRGVPGGSEGSCESRLAGDMPVDAPSRENRSDRAQENLFELLGKPKRDFIRLRVGGVYKDGRWLPPENRKPVKYHGGEISPRVQKFSEVQTREVSVKPLVSFIDLIPTFSHPILLSGVENLSFYPGEDVFSADSGVDRLYEIGYRNYFYGEDLLRGAGLASKPSYLQLPQDVTGRTKKLAYEITENMSSAYGKARAIESYLENNYEYDENYRRTPSGYDPVDWFLFEEKKGVCTNFNSAFAVLARCVGIPARVVSGYRINREENRQKIDSMQKHLIAEVAFKKCGWIPFDSTSRGPSSCIKPGKGKVLLTKEFISAEGRTCSGGPLFELVKPPGKNFVRLTVGEVYENGGWTPIDNREIKYSGQKISSTIKGFEPSSTRKVTVNPLVPVKGFIPSFSHPVVLRGVENLKYYPDRAAFFSPQTIDSYDIEHQVYSYEEETLRTATPVDDREYLQLSSGVTKKYKNPKKKYKNPNLKETVSHCRLTPPILKFPQRGIKASGGLDIGVGGPPVRGF